MPPSGQPASLAERNKIIGNKWTSLPDMEQLVYDPTIFYTLSGLPSPKKVEPVKLSSADRDELQNIYDESVSINKVSKVYASVAEGIPGGQSLADHNRLSQKRVKEIHSEVR